jgi:phage FluMu gp28-like protein
MPLVRRFQDRACRIPMDAAVREDLHAVRKTVTAAGNVRLDAERSEDGHADRFWAAALACHASDPSKTPLPAPLMRKPVGW